MKLKDEKYRVWIQNIQKNFQQSNNSIHKVRNEIKIIPYEKETYVVKSFKIPNIFNKIIYTFFKKSKAKKSYENSIKLDDFTPKPIAYIEFKKKYLLDESYFISQHFIYDFTIREVLLDNNFLDRNLIFKTFADFTYDLHQANILHLDYSPGNILIKKEKDIYTFKVVDINRMRFKNLDLKERLKNFAKLWASDEALKIIVKSYAKQLKEDEDKCIKIALRYSHAHKNKINTKKRVRGVKVVD